MNITVKRLILIGFLVTSAKHVKLIDMFPHTRANIGYLPTKRISHGHIHAIYFLQLSIPLKTCGECSIDQKEIDKIT